MRFAVPFFDYLHEVAFMTACHAPRVPGNILQGMRVHLLTVVVLSYVDRH